jgi:hypothetical protein
MKRFLILFTLIAFVTVSWAEPNKWGWTKPDFSQDQYEKDRKECIESIDNDLNSEAFGKALEQCLQKEGYEFKKAEEPQVTAKDIALIALGIVLIPLGVAYSIWLIGCAP